MNENLSLGDMNTLTGDEVNKTNGQLLSVGDKIGGYKVIKQLGAGGMGQVYLVENIHMHKQYALKVLPPNLSQNTNFIDRFKVEARVMADLEHPGIVGVHNIGHDEKHGLYYLAMSYIEAGKNQPSDLEVLLKEQKKLPEEEVLKITKQICSALEYAHNFRGKGIVHRDLKPSNILLDADGNAHIADFGLAKVVGSDYLKSMIDRSMRLTMAGGGANTANMSLGDMNTMAGSDPSSTLKPSNVQHSTAAGTGSAGSLIGTYEYMAPEQQDGQEATVQSDIYSLGLIIYRMLTGKKVKGRFKLPSELGFSAEWDEIINKCLENEQEDRFTSVSEIIPLLNFSVTTKGTKNTKKKFKTTKSTGFVSFTKAAVILVVLAGIVIGGWHGYKAYEKKQFEKAASVRLAQMKKEKQQKITKLASDMNSAYNSGKYPEASKYANQVLSLDPGNSSAEGMIQKIIDSSSYKEMTADIAYSAIDVNKSKKTRIGIISSMPVMGTPESSTLSQSDLLPPWIFIQELQKYFDVKKLNYSIESIDRNIDLLMIVHPNNISKRTEYAIDQYLLNGGRILIFTDPYSFSSQKDVLSDKPIPPTASTLPTLFNVWGIEFSKPGQVVLAPENAYHSITDPLGKEHPAILSLTGNMINQNNVVTAGLDKLNLVFSGAFTGDPAEGLSKTVLLKTSLYSSLFSNFNLQPETVI